MSEEQVEAGRKNPRMLDDGEKLQLWNFLRGIEGQIRAEGLDRHAVARMVRESVGLDVGPHHIAHAAGVLKIDLPRKKAPPREGGGKYKRIAEALEIRVCQLETRLATLEADLKAAVHLIEQQATDRGEKHRLQDGKIVPPVRLAK